MFSTEKGNLLKSPWAKALIALAVIGVVGAAVGVPVALTLTQTTTAAGKHHSRHNAHMDKNRSLTSLVLPFQ
jgi:hypothetical protein